MAADGYRAWRAPSYPRAAQGAHIGAECIIGRDDSIDVGVEIGSRVEIQNAALAGHGVTADDGVFIGPNAILTKERFPRAITVSGELAQADDRVVSRQQRASTESNDGAKLSG